MDATPEILALFEKHTFSEVAAMLKGQFELVDLRVAYCEFKKTKIVESIGNRFMSQDKRLGDHRASLVKKKRTSINQHSEVLRRNISAEQE